MQSKKSSKKSVKKNKPKAVHMVLDVCNNCGCAVCWCVEEVFSKEEWTDDREKVTCPKCKRELRKIRGK